MKKFNGKTKEDLEARAKILYANSDDWENGTLGESEEYAAVMRKTSIRLPDELIESLKLISHNNGIPYQTYIRMILTQHVTDKRNTASK